MKLIALDDGHGSNTPGKRTPLFQDGSFMHENEFNKRVVELLNGHLQRCGFRTLLVAPTDVDTPLQQRTDVANKNKADFYISVHANALTGTWERGGKGIETFHYPNSVEGKKAATIIHRHLMKGTSFIDRGVKSANFHVLRETHMPAVLVECGFMDDRTEAELLKSEQYRQECAKEIAKGICEYFNVVYFEEKEQMSKEDANKLIGYLGALYNLSNSKEEKAEYHRLANELRKASNQPIS